MIQINVSGIEKGKIAMHKCPNCGKQTLGSYDQGGIWDFCPDCLFLEECARDCYVDDLLDDIESRYEKLSDVFVKKGREKS